MPTPLPDGRAGDGRRLVPRHRSPWCHGRALACRPAYCIAVVEFVAFHSSCHSADDRLLRRNHDGIGVPEARNKSRRRHTATWSNQLTDHVVRPASTLMHYIDAFNHFFPEPLWSRMAASSDAAQGISRRMQGIPAIYDLDERMRILRASVITAKYSRSVCRR